MPRAPHVTATTGGEAYKAKNVQPFRVPSDPRPSGPLCICGCGQQRSKTATAHEDPFATTDCCRAYYFAPRP